MEKLKIEELENIFGGENKELCKAVQALAALYREDGASEKDWSTWVALYEEYC
ncbi:hypothetical protein [Prevotella sp. HUN102]|uniref:hypothetical protein n=1 Tax=Prevotella sp. HUN102 TaxID=1392486 RepID=UPI0012DCFD9B|nr:hypothetical protein [Prevotella sp. HUN102]